MTPRTILPPDERLEPKTDGRNTALYFRSDDGVLVHHACGPDRSIADLAARYKGAGVIESAFLGGCCLDAVDTAARGDGCAFDSTHWNCRENTRRDLVLCEALARAEGRTDAATWCREKLMAL